MEHTKLRRCTSVKSRLFFFGQELTLALGIKLKRANAISCCIISPGLTGLKAERGSFRCVCSPQSGVGNSRHPSAILGFYDVVTSLVERKAIIFQVRVLDTCLHLLTCRATVLIMA